MEHIWQLLQKDQYHVDTRKPQYYQQIKDLFVFLFSFHLQNFKISIILNNLILKKVILQIRICRIIVLNYADTLHLSKYWNYWYGVCDFTVSSRQTLSNKKQTKQFLRLLTIIGGKFGPVFIFVKMSISSYPIAGGVGMSQSSSWTIKGIEVTMN